MALRGLMPDELLKRAAHMFRLGRAPMGSVSFQAYLNIPDRKQTQYDGAAAQAIMAGDYLCAADIILFGILPEACP